MCWFPIIYHWTQTAVTVGIQGMFDPRTPTNNVLNFPHLPEYFKLSPSKWNPNCSPSWYLSIFCSSATNQQCAELPISARVFLAFSFQIERKLQSHLIFEHSLLPGHQPTMCQIAIICRSILSFSIPKWTQTAVAVDIWAGFAPLTPAEDVLGCHHLPEYFKHSHSKLNPNCSRIWYLSIVCSPDTMCQVACFPVPNGTQTAVTVDIWALFAPQAPTNDVPDCHEPNWKQNCMHSFCLGNICSWIPKGKVLNISCLISWRVPIPIFVAQTQMPALVCAIESWNPVCCRPLGLVSWGGSAHHLTGCQCLHCCPQKASCLHWNLLSPKWQKCPQAAGLSCPLLVPLKNYSVQRTLLANSSSFESIWQITTLKLAYRGGWPHWFLSA